MIVENRAPAGVNERANSPLAHYAPMRAMRRTHVLGEIVGQGGHLIRAGTAPRAAGAKTRTNPAGAMAHLLYATAGSRLCYRE